MLIEWIKWAKSGECMLGSFQEWQEAKAVGEHVVLVWDRMDARPVR